jgi:hypothetical protein
MTTETELVQTRAALAQLLEYRFFYGAEADKLCLVSNAPLSDRRLRFLDAMDVQVLWHNETRFVPCGGKNDWLLAPCPPAPSVRLAARELKREGTASHHWRPTSLSAYAAGCHACDGIERSVVHSW